MKTFKKISMLPVFFLFAVNTTAFATGCAGISVNNAVDLQTALSGVANNPSTGMPTSDGDTICISAGVYVPQTETIPMDDRSRSFEVKVDNLTLQGAGDGLTILSGEIGDIGTKTDNIYSVIQANSESVSRLTIKDLKITHGYASPNEFFDLTTIVGGGLLYYGPNPGKLHLERVHFHDNYAFFLGGGAFIGADPNFYLPVEQQSHLTILASRFTNNIAGIEEEGAGNGGGLFTAGFNLTISQSKFKSNQAFEFAGAVAIIDGVANIQHSEFTENKARAAAGALSLFRENIGTGGLGVGSDISHNIFNKNSVVGPTEFPDGYAGAISLTQDPDASATNVFSYNVFIDNTAPLALSNKCN